MFINRIASAFRRKAKELIGLLVREYKYAAPRYNMLMNSPGDVMAAGMTMALIGPRE